MVPEPVKQQLSREKEQKEEAERILRMRLKVEEDDLQFAVDLFTVKRSVMSQKGVTLATGIDSDSGSSLKVLKTLSMNGIEAFKEINQKPNRRAQCGKQVEIEEAKKYLTRNPKVRSKKELKAEVDRHADIFGGFIENEFADFEDKIYASRERARWY